MIRIEHHPTRRQLLVFGLAWLIVFGILGAMAYWKSGSPATAAALWTLAAAIPAAGLVWPEFLRIVFLLASYATFPIGFVVSHLVLAVVYYFVLTPTAILLRLRGYDPMQRRFDRNAKTYWTPRQPEGTTERYFKQF